MSFVRPSNYGPSKFIFGLENELKNLIKLCEISKLPKVLMLSGEKGIGKFTMVLHFLTNYFDKKKYDLNNFKIAEDSIFYQHFLKEIFPNIIYVSGSNFNIEDIRALKTRILKSSIIDKERFIIFDDIELLNKNCINALLKIIEEPTIKNNFILINNKKKEIIETIHSRSLEFKITLNHNKRINIIESLIKKNDLNNINIDYKSSNISPGNFLNLNEIIIKHKIDLEEDFLDNFSLLMKLYKKEKNSYIIDLVLYLTEIHFFKISQRNGINLEKVIDDKSFIITNLDRFLLYNLNHNSLINAINNRFLNE